MITTTTTIHVPSHPHNFQLLNRRHRPEKTKINKKGLNVNLVDNFSLFFLPKIDIELPLLSEFLTIFKCFTIISQLIQFANIFYFITRIENHIKLLLDNHHHYPCSSSSAQLSILDRCSSARNDKNKYKCITLIWLMIFFLCFF